MANERRVPCPICNTINNRLLTRECDTCKIPYHFKCVTPRLTRRLSNSLLVWSCPTCTGRGDLNQNHQIPDIELEQKLPQLIGEWKTNIKVMSRVPKGARVAAAEALATLMDDVTANNSTMRGLGSSGLPLVPFSARPKQRSATRTSLLSPLKHVHKSILTWHLQYYLLQPNPMTTPLNRRLITH